MADGTIYVINPNSNADVTNEIDSALSPLRHARGPRISCITLAEGPAGIETQRDADGVIGPLLRRAASLESDAAAFVVACFSDPGIHALREQSARPVFGIAECGVLTAMALGRRVGIIAILPASVARHHRYFTSLGLTTRIAGELPVGLRVGELADEQCAIARMVDVGRTLRDGHGADVLVLGCAGMARYRSALEKSLAVPVVDPTHATVAIALGRLASIGDG
jgi:Asp/Glu/hydantoin racemase